ncbi:hypothetical protein JL101_036460 (plasmid) [Skermanella rosea]|uniref:hypothetical protein n=1 Tax=Skermanella rosea TaxID=1817965 RepID=UPI00193339A7|nr:hypothetical protein [Skermanella rosea]UEM08237.1 hypothetical protein JL101_036460 [Skermanella rosea]
MHRNVSTYQPRETDSSYRLGIVAAALRAADVADFRPAPAASIAFVPGHAREIGRAA